MELKKIHAGELKNLSKQRKLTAVKTAVENSHGVLKNFFQQSIVQVLQDFAPGLRGEDIFPAFISRRRESLALREDMAVLQALLDRFEEITETTEAGARRETWVLYLLLQKEYIRAMREDTCKHMRYQDLIEFEKYFTLVEELAFEDLHRDDQLDKFKMESKFFKILVETTIGHINNRTDLQDEPLDPARVMDRLHRFLAGRLEDLLTPAAGREATTI
jgi:hypothetical protein